MILNFREDFRGTIIEGLNLLALLNKVIAQREQYLGNSKNLDILYARSVALSSVISRIWNTDGTTPEYDKELLLCLRKLVGNKKNFCTTK
jgi:hypothetical protein